MQSTTITHVFAPVFDRYSRVLVLGTMPSPMSRVHRFYYSHPQNRFWPLLSDFFGEALPKTPEEKTAFALRHRIALWDVLARCDIRGASDASIRNPVPNDLGKLLEASAIRVIFTTGKTATRFYEKLVYPKIGRASVYLPSTSPANQALFPYDKLKEAWQPLMDALEDGAQQPS